MMKAMTAALVMVGFCWPAGAQVVDQQIIEIRQEDEQEARELAISSRSRRQPRRDLVADTGGDYRIGIGVYGAYNPIIRPDETWIRYACFSEPGRSYQGFSLLAVNIRLFFRGRQVLDTADRSPGVGIINDRGVCDINEGVDVSFIDVDRYMEFDSWEIYVTAAEKREMGVVTGATIRPRLNPQDCPKARNCRQSTVVHEYPVHLYR